MPDPQAMFHEAVRLHAAGQLAAAEQLYRALLVIDAQHAPGLHGLGTLALDLKQYGVAVEMIGKAIAVEDANAIYHFNLGLAHQNLRQHDAAIASYRRAAALKPDLVAAYTNLAKVFEQQGRIEDAAGCFEQAILFKPESGPIHHAFGIVLKNGGRRREAVERFRRAADLNPGYGVFTDLAATLMDLGEAGEALAACEAALAARPDFHAPYALKADILFNLGRPGEAVTACRTALALKPNSPRANSNLLYMLTHAHLLPPEEILVLARGFETAVNPSPGRPFVPRRMDPTAKLRVAFLCAEVGMHSVANFLETYLRHYDRAQVEVWLYSTRRFSDERRGRLMALADHAVDVDNVPDDLLRDRIIADEIHILIDTTGHTGHGKLPMLAQRCAPIQCAYMGYFGTTGVRAMDYFIGDPEISPPAFAFQFSERLVQLPDIWMAYTPAAPLPEPESMSGDDEIVLGSFNNFAKVREDTLDLWSRLLLEIPSARLVLKDRLTADAASRSRILMHIERLGANPARVEFLPKVESWKEHMALYNRVDIALDTFPFTSATTGFDAVYMGVPLVAMRGSTKAGRMSSSIVKALGRPDWIAEDAGAYVAIVRELAADKAALRRYKKTLRAEMMASPVGDGPRLARGLDAALRKMAEAYDAGYQS
jgi:predicted O-linked N-acetylglucosamine transferase (SPINDLY family)